MARVLIVYSTKEGHTREIAERIARTIHDDGNEVQVSDVNGAGKQALAAFDGILVGGSVHLGAYQASLRDFVKRNRESLERVPSSFFSVSMSAADASKESIAEVQATLDKFFRDTGWHPRHVENFAGALLYTRYNFLVRFILKRIVKSKGRPEVDTSRDYDLTDWAAVERFAHEFAANSTRRLPV
jgi:menaquinone-dependent protoporphyrinogen oxidase